MALHIFIFGSSTGIGLRGGKTTRNYSEVLFLYEKKRAEGVTWIKVKEEIWLHNYPTQRGSLFWPAFRLRFLFPGVWLVFFFAFSLAGLHFLFYTQWSCCVCIRWWPSVHRRRLLLRQPPASIPPPQQRSTRSEKPFTQYSAFGVPCFSRFTIGLRNDGSYWHPLRDWK